MQKKVPIKVDCAPGGEYSLRNRFWQGCPTIARTAGGRLFAGWYSGGYKEPDPANYNLLISSDDDGWHWSKERLVIPSSPEDKYIAIDIQLWIDPADRLWLFVTQRFYNDGMIQTMPHHLANWAIVCDDPDADTLHWSEPQYIAPGFLRCQPTVLSNGDWLLCAYNWASDRYCYSRSRDNGKTWELEYGPAKSCFAFDETMMLETADHHLSLYARCNNPLLHRAESTDLNGTSWSSMRPTPLLNGQSRFFIRRLNSGRVLLIHNDSSLLRANLRAALSEDDGVTFPHALQLDTTTCRERNVSYPDAAIAPDGRIFILHDCGRNCCKEIRMSRITEDDILAGRLADPDSYTSRIISKAPGRPLDQELYRKTEEYHRTVFAPLFTAISKPQADDTYIKKS